MSLISKLRNYLRLFKPDEVKYKAYRVAIIEDKYSYEIYGSANEDDEEMLEAVISQSEYKKGWEDGYTCTLYKRIE